MIKLATMLLLPGAIAVAPIVVARLSSLFCGKCNDDNWLSEGGNCGHGAWMWSLMFTLPVAIIVLLLLLFFMPWI